MRRRSVEGDGSDDESFIYAGGYIIAKNGLTVNGVIIANQLLLKNGSVILANLGDEILPDWLTETEGMSTTYSSDIIGVARSNWSELL